MTHPDSHQCIAVVTGANTGIGYETALGLAREGYTVILACRTPAKAEQAMTNIRKKLPKADIAFIQLDLVDRDSIRNFSQAVHQQFDHIDALINNAGVMGPPYTITQNNLELQLDANHMGHFYLTYLLFDLLDQAYETRIINVSSLAGKREAADIHFDNINFEGKYDEGPSFMGLSGLVAYSQSKLANILFTMELKKKLEQAGIQINPIVVHPGISNTDLSRHFPAFLRFLVPIVKYFFTLSEPAGGAKPSLYAALQEDVRAGDFIGPTNEGERIGPPGQGVTARQGI